MFTHNPKWIPLSEITFRIWSHLEGFIPDELIFDPDGEVESEPVPPHYYQDAENGYKPKTVWRSKSGKLRKTIWVPVGIPTHSEKTEVAPKRETAPGQHLEPVIRHRIKDEEELWAYYYAHFRNLRNECVWKHIDAHKTKAKTFLRNGSPISISPAIFHRNDSDLEGSNTHIDINIGTIGSGHLRRLPHPERDDCEIGEVLKISYGDLLYQPILFERAQFGNYFEDLKTHEWKLPTLTDPEIVKEILNLHREGVTKPDIKERIEDLISPLPMKTVTWNLHWQSASEKDPTLGKPGRKMPSPS